ncbi:MAG: AlwI family type II restriction endonuclease, partial [Candidatus Alkaliphilus sp. MAG34]
MQILNIPYQSFCWVIGTTSFRTAKLNLKIEEQLILLSEFHEKYLHKFDTWAWNKESQALYYDFMKKNGFIYGEAKRKDKDAREKTSGLVDIGLINDDRTLTEAGNELLNIARQGDFREDNYFNIDKDSYVYLKQLLKTSIKVGAFTVRPYLILAKVLKELEYLTYDEFTYILPLTVDNKSTRSIINRIRDYRMGKATLEDIIYEDLMDMENYRLAYKTFMRNRLSEELICLVGMNRKSRNYDRPYYNLLVELIRVFHHGEEERAYDLFLAAKKISHKPAMLWRNMIFATSVTGNIRKNGIKTVRRDCIFKETKSEREIKTTFYKYMHVFKAMATLADYFDLNRRYFNLTDTLIFEDNIVKFDLIPKYFFKECIEKVY